MKTTRFIFIASTCAIVAFIVISFFVFGNQLNLHITKNIETSLQEQVQPNTISFVLQIEEQIKKVVTLADFLGNNWDLPESVKQSLLVSAAKGNNLFRCALAYQDGRLISHDGKTVGDVSDNDFFIANMAGALFISDPSPAAVDPSQTIVLFSAPVFDASKQVVGALVYSYLCSDLDEMFNLYSMDGALSLVLTNSTGEILMGSSPYAKPENNLLDALTQSCTHESHKGAPCIAITQTRGTHMLSYGSIGQHLFVFYEKLPYADWYIVGTISEHAAGAGISFAAQNQRHLSIFIACGALVYGSILLVLWLLQRKLVDTETGVPTLYAFKKYSRRIFKAHKSEQYVVVMLDIKDFKLINRIHSFATGDRVIKCVAQALNLALRHEDSAVARVGIDTFVLLLPYEGNDALSTKREAFIKHFRELMQDSFCRSIVFPTGQYILKPSDFPKPDINEIFEKVNFAHRAAKQKSDIIIDYEDDIETAALFIKSIEDRMEDAIKAKEFTLYLQPKVNLKSETLCGAEALVRWKLGDTSYMYPTDFIPVLEKNGFIVQLDFYMFECAVIFLRQCMDEGVAPITISVNFSRHHLVNQDFISHLCAITDRHAVPHHYLELEVTESAFLGHTEDMIKLIHDAHQANFLFSMDDFGSGYSCFAQLKDLPIDVIKIDKGFFDKGEDEARARVIIAGIINIARQLNITTVAEGIEEASQITMLKELHCDIVQGYFYARPMPASQLDIANFTVPVITK